MLVLIYVPLKVFNFPIERKSKKGLLRAISHKKVVNYVCNSLRAYFLNRLKHHNI